MVQALLALYEGQPAIFCRQAPGAGSPGWGGGERFPHVLYQLDWLCRPGERPVGRLKLQAVCSTAGPVAPEGVAKALQNALCRVFLTEADGCYCAVFRRMRALPPAGDGEQGSAVWFDLLPFPVPGEALPGPVRAAGALIRQVLPGCRFIGWDTLEPIWRPRADTPAVYVRLVGCTPVGHSSPAAAWLQAELRVHLILPGWQDGWQQCQQLAQFLALEGELGMEDGAPLLLTEAFRLDMAADPVRHGQLSLTGRYGLLPPGLQEPLFEHAAFRWEG